MLSSKSICVLCLIVLVQQTQPTSQTQTLVREEHDAQQHPGDAGKIVLDETVSEPQNHVSDASNHAKSGRFFGAYQRLVREQTDRGLALIKSLTGSLGSKISHSFIQPVEDYTQLVGRYRQWYRRYRAVQSRLPAGAELTPISQMVKEEYAKIDRLQFECKSNELLAAANVGLDNNEQIRYELENMDLVFDIIGKLTRGLERRLMSEMLEFAPNLSSSLVRDDIGETDDDDDDDDTGAEDKQHMDEAMSRLKRIALKTTTHLALSHASRMALRMALDFTAAKVTKASGQDSPTNAVLEIIRMLSSNSASIAVMCLRDPKFHLAFNWLSTRAIDAFNPLPALQCKLERRIFSR